MDNIIEIIVFFFVIYSILGSIFGKKKKPLPKRQQQQRRRPVAYREPGDKELKLPKQPSSKDILEELFGVKIPNTEDEYSYQSRRTDDNLEYRSWDPQKEFEKKVEQKEKYEYRNIEKEIPDIDYDKTSSLEAVQKRIKTTVATNEHYVKRTSNKRTLDIKMKLKDPLSVQDLLLVSEILGKPKALRR